MSVVVVKPFPSPITPVHDEPGVILHALHKGLDWLVMIEKYESERRDRSI